MAVNSQGQRQATMAEELRRSLDVEGLAAGREPMGLLGKYLYEGDGAGRWRAFAKHPDNYVPRDATRLVLERSGKLLEPCPSGCAVCLLGAAPREAQAFVGALDGPKHVYAVDIAQAYAEEVADHLGEAFPGLGVTPVVLDYFNDDLPMANAAGPTLTLFPSSNISNIPAAIGVKPTESPRVIKQMARFREQTQYLAVVFDSNVDVPSLEAAYAGRAYEELATGLESLLEVAPDFDVTALEAAQYWDPNGQTFVHRVRSTRRQSVRILGDDCIIETGQLIYPMHSYKFALGGEGEPSDLGRVMNKAGWGSEPMSRVLDSGGRLAAELYQRTE